MLGFLAEAFFYVLLGMGKRRLRPVAVLVIATIVIALAIITLVTNTST